MLWKVVKDEELFVFWRGGLIYKKWLSQNSSVVCDIHGQTWWYHEETTTC